VTVFVLVSLSKHAQHTPHDHVIRTSLPLDKGRQGEVTEPMTPTEFEQPPSSLWQDGVARHRRSRLRSILLEKIVADIIHGEHRSCRGVSLIYLSRFLLRFRIRDLRPSRGVDKRKELIQYVTLGDLDSSNARPQG
jgi:hypothetical protein